MQKKSQKIRRPQGFTAGEWAFVVQEEPELADISEEIRTLPGNEPHFCVNVAWIEHGFASRLLAISRRCRDNDAIFFVTPREREAYMLAFYKALPPCKGCECF